MYVSGKRCIHISNHFDASYYETSNCREVHLLPLHMVVDEKYLHTSLFHDDSTPHVKPSPLVLCSRSWRTSTFAFCCICSGRVFVLWNLRHSLVPRRSSSLFFCFPPFSTTRQNKALPDTHKVHTEIDTPHTNHTSLDDPCSAVTTKYE